MSSVQLFSFDIQGRSIFHHCFRGVMESFPRGVLAEQIAGWLGGFVTLWRCYKFSGGCFIKQ